MIAAKIAPLDKVGWLASEGQRLRDWVAEVGHWRVYEPGQVIYSVSDPSDGLHGLGSGTLSVRFPLVAEEPVFLHLAEPGFWIGDAAELAQIPRVVTLLASSRSRVLHVPSRAIQSLLAANAEHWPAFYRLSVMNVRTVIREYAEALSLTVRARVCRHLIRLTSGPNALEVTQDELAQLVGVARGTMRRCLADLTNLGAIDTQYRKIRVLDPSTLERFRNEQ